MQTENVEYNELIATRVPDALEAWFDQNQEQVEFRLAPLDSKLYVIRSEEKEIVPEPTKRYNIYGDPL